MGETSLGPMGSLSMALPSCLPRSVSASCEHLPIRHPVVATCRAGKPDVRDWVAIAIVLASHPFNSGTQLESIPRVLLMILFMRMSVGLWKGKFWAGRLSLLLHWLTMKAALIGLPISILIIIITPKKGIAMALVFAIYAAIAFVPLILVSAFVVRCLRRGKFFSAET